MSELPRARFEFRTFAPRPALKGRVAVIEIVENEGGETLVLPSTSAVLGLQFRGRVRQGTEMLSLAGITGILGGARTYSYVGATGSVLVRFTAQGAACFGVTASELANRSVALADLLPASHVAEASERLQAQVDDRSRVAVVEELLLRLPFARDPVVTRAVERLTSPDDAASVAVIARELGLSERQLERRFVARVGIMPKRFARLRRFERAVALARTAPSLSAVAQGAGYCDQSHFIRDFRGFAGVAPSAGLGRFALKEP